MTQAALYDTDSQRLAELVALAAPDDAALIDAARLQLRYQGNPAATDFNAALEQLLERWGLDRQALQRRTRELWASGWRPAPALPAAPVGSGSDVDA